MIRFFRGIRRKLIAEGKIKNFLLYTIGEILLVVIGILLALQINNWYENEKNSDQEIAILKNLKLEQESNLNQLSEKIIGCQDRIRNDSLILQLTGMNRSSISEQELIPILSSSVYPITFDPSNGTISDIFNSGKINLIKNEELRVAISEWESELSEVKEAEKYLIELSIIPIQLYLSDKIVLRNVYKDYAGQSKHNQQIQFLSEMKFENLIVNSILNLNILENRYLMIKREIESMIEMIDEEVSH